ncbi:Hypothetical protein D9617_67g071780 [Elsinoe fawcettii]|nr:Hypothetical protein D9617_67g071780 [Elsinoe fawcettii]
MYESPPRIELDNDELQSLDPNIMFLLDYPSLQLPHDGAKQYDASSNHSKESVMESLAYEKGSRDIDDTSNHYDMTVSAYDHDIPGVLAQFQRLLDLSAMAMGKRIPELVVVHPESSRARDQDEDHGSCPHQKTLKLILDDRNDPVLEIWVDSKVASIHYFVQVDQSPIDDRSNETDILYHDCDHISRLLAAGVAVLHEILGLRIPDTIHQGHVTLFQHVGHSVSQLFSTMEGWCLDDLFTMDWRPEQCEFSEMPSPFYMTCILGWASQLEGSVNAHGAANSADNVNDFSCTSRNSGHNDINKSNDDKQLGNSSRLPLCHKDEMNINTFDFSLTKPWICQSNMQSLSSEVHEKLLDAVRTIRVQIRNRMENLIASLQEFLIDDAVRYSRLLKQKAGTTNICET